MNQQAIPLNILICDPDANKSAALQKILSDLGHQEVKHVDDGQKFSLAAAHLMPDLIVLGNDFGDVRTSDLILQIKKAPLLATIPLALYTQDVSEDFVAQIMKYGIVGHLSYPATRQSVEALLRAYHRVETSPRLTSRMQQSNFFRGFERDELLEMLRTGVARRFEPGETIIERGALSCSFFVLLEGEAESVVINDRRGTLSVPIKTGAVFGEIGVLDQMERSAWCLAASDCLVLEVGCAVLSSRDPSLTTKLYKQMARFLASKLRAMRCVLDEEMAGTFSSTRLGVPREDVGELELQDATDKPPRESASDEFAPSTAKELMTSPLATPTAIALEVDESVTNEDDYEVLVRKVELRTDFLYNKINETVSNTIRNKMFGYLTGSKLARHNPHKLWSNKLFLPRSTRLKDDLHLVVLCPFGEEAFRSVYFGLSLTHRVVGLHNMGCSGTFLGSQEAIDRYLTAQSLQKALRGDLALGISRPYMNNPTIEFLTHSMADVRAETLFLVVEDKDGVVTRKVREVFPEHQIVTVVRDIKPKLSMSKTLFTVTEEVLRQKELLVKRDEYTGSGFYENQTFFIPDLSEYFSSNEQLSEFGFLFGTIGIFAAMGPDYSGRIWGTHGGARGAMRAARARYGLKGAQSASDMADAIDWADQ